MAERTSPPALPSPADGGGSETGIVFDVQGYSLHDGPGIRTVVFLKGCPLSCAWCCNPESQRLAPEVEYHAERCVGCGRCAEGCPTGACRAGAVVATEKIDRSLCDDRLACAFVCPTGALRVVGERLIVGDVLARIRRDAPFYRRSGGGVTLSGGEPLVQWRFAAALASACHDENIAVALETSGHAPWAHLAAVLEHADLVLYDLKGSDDARHRAATGVGLDLILGNLRRLAESGAPFILRLPLVPNHNLDEARLRRAGELAADLGALEVHLMPYHGLGVEKHHRLGRAYSLAGVAGMRDSADGRADIERAVGLVGAAGASVLVGG